MNDLTQNELKRLFHYNPETGKFTRLVRTANNVKIGDIAGAINKAGYLVITINNKLYLAHRLAFLYMEGKFPEKGIQVDHINQIRNDNRLVNLRLVTRQDNLKNCSISKNNTSGAVGVSLHKSTNKWIAGITVNREKKHLGCFDNLDDAIAARKAAEIKYNFHENHGKQINQLI